MSGPWQEYLEQLYETYREQGLTHDEAKEKAWEQFEHETYEPSDLEEEEPDDAA